MATQLYQKDFDDHAEVHRLLFLVFWNMLVFVCHLGVLFKSGFSTLVIEPEKDQYDS